MKTELLLALAACCPLAHAGDVFSRVGQQPLRQAWIDTGFATYHFDRSRGLNGNNFGLGAEYRFRGDLALIGGRFHNSDREYSNYAGLVWQPLAFGPVRLGAVAGVFNGYPHMREGGWFPALIPVATLEYQRVGVNFGFVPTYRTGCTAACRCSSSTGCPTSARRTASSAHQKCSSGRR